MEGLRRKAANVFLPSKHYILSLQFRDVLLQEEAHQCYKRSLPWKHPLGGQNCIFRTCFRSLKRLCT
jgi:hypothetical protein